MSREIIFRPSTSRPSQFERAADYRDFDSRYVLVTHRDALVAVYDTTATLGPPPFTNFRVPDISTTMGIVTDVLSMIGEGGGLADFVGLELCLWNDSRVVAVIHDSLNVQSIEMPGAVSGTQPQTDHVVMLYEISQALVLS